jgi:hypothetical protein
VDFVALTSRSFGVDNPSTVAQFRTGTGLPNAGPKVGPVVMNEVMYHPVTINGTNTSENTDEEYVELFNITPKSVTLYDPQAATNHWKISGDVDYVFPGNVSLPAGGFLVVAGFDPVTNGAALANFRTKYAVSTNVPVFGPYNGHLNNGGGSLALYLPDTPQAAPHPDAGFVPYVLVEQVSYTDSAPWPTSADGLGMSLQRALLGSYANEPLNWVACAPNPGTRNCLADADGDGLPDDWELANGLNPNSAAGNDGANGDPDGDRFTNLQEFLAGTNPRDAQSLLKISSIARTNSAVALSFGTIATRTYSVQYRTNLQAGTWQKLTDVGPFPTNSAAVVTDSLGSQTTRFYRITTPKLP